MLGARIIDTHSEWRTFNNDDQNNDDPSRVGDGPNLLLNGEGLATTIAFSDGSRNARELTRAHNKTIQDKGNKALMAAYKQIGAMCDSIHLEQTVSQHAKLLYKTVYDAGTFRGKNTDSIIAGIIFISCRTFRVGRTFREIHKLTHVSKKDIGRTFKSLEKFFDDHNRKMKEKEAATSNAHRLSTSAEQDKTTSIAIDEQSELASTTTAAPAITATTPGQLVGRYCSALQMNRNAEMCSEKLADHVVQQGALAGRSPLSVAAACILFTCSLLQVDRTLKSISTVAGISEGTLRTTYNRLVEMKESLFEGSWLKDQHGNIRGDPTKVIKV